jgi:hypothetical protein
MATGSNGSGFSNDTRSDTRVRPALRAVLAALALCVAAGCLTVGKTFKVQGVQGLEIGKTTRDDVRKSFGEPWRTGVENGQRTWTYGHYRYAVFGTTMTRDLVVRFDDKDVVVSYNFNSTYAEDRDLMKR